MAGTASPRRDTSSETDDRGAELDVLKPRTPNVSNAATVADTTAEGEFSVPTLPALHQAAQRGDMTKVNTLLNAPGTDRKALVAEIADDGTTALHWAAGGNFLRVSELLINNGADINYRGGSAKATPLHWACRSGNAYVVRMLVEAGGDLSIKDDSGFTPLHLAVHSSNVLMVAYLVHLDVPLDVGDNLDRTPLHWALSQGDFMSVEVLLRSGASPTRCDGQSTYPLELAARSHVTSSIELLLRFGADPAVASPAIKSEPQWKLAIKNCGRRIDGTPVPLPRFLGQRGTELAVSLSSLFLLPLSFWLDYTFAVVPFGNPFIVALVWYVAYGIIRDRLAPAAWPSGSPVFRSTFMAGFFVAVFTLIIIFYMGYMLPAMFATQPSLCILVLLVITSLVYNYVATATRDPGYIRPGSVSARKEDIHHLMDEGRYTSHNFCRHTFVTIPPRAHYDKFTGLVVRRFDHYCPWTYNPVGLKNHRTFACFVLLLSFGIAIVGYQYVAYLRIVGDSSVWTGLKRSPFSIRLAFVTCIQAVWIYILTATQLIQIASGKTTYEISGHHELSGDQASVFGSLPSDHPLFEEISDALQSRSRSSTRRHVHRHHGGRWAACFRLLGLQQALTVSRMVTQISKRGDSRGWKSNCAEFWWGNIS